jgi:fermentation-respiration switch protein FrsA (DUF1100 family)
VEIDGSPLAFPGGETRERGVPLLLIHGDADTTFPVDDSRTMYAAARGPKYLIVLHGVQHVPFRVQAAMDVIVPTVGAFLDAYLKQRPDAVAALLRDAAVPGFTEVTSAPGHGS